jgi:hypothetical protein
MSDLLWKLSFDAGGDAVTRANYTHVRGIEFIAPIGSDDLNLDRVVNRGAKRGLSKSLFIQRDFCRWGAGDAGADVHAARKMRWHMYLKLIGMQTCTAGEHPEYCSQNCER